MQLASFSIHCSSSFEIAEQECIRQSPPVSMEAVISSVRSVQQDISWYDNDDFISKPLLFFIIVILLLFFWSFFKNDGVSAETCRDLRFVGI